MGAVVLAAETATAVGIAILTGGVAGAAVTAIFGPYVATRQARIETYRKWQVDLSTEFLDKAAELRPLLKARSANAETDSTMLVKTLDELDTLAQRVALIFTAKAGAPSAARQVVETAGRAETDLEALDTARNRFVDCASDEIRGRGIHFWHEQGRLEVLTQ